MENLYPSCSSHPFGTERSLASAVLMDAGAMFFAWQDLHEGAQLNYPARCQHGLCHGPDGGADHRLIGSPIAFRSPEAANVAFAPTPSWAWCSTQRDGQRKKERRPMTKGLLGGFVVLTLVAALAGDAIAQAAYPAKGQSPQQQQKDMAECQGGRPSSRARRRRRRPAARQVRASGVRRGERPWGPRQEPSAATRAGSGRGRYGGGHGGRHAPPSGSSRRHGGQLERERGDEQCAGRVPRGPRLHGEVEGT